MATVADKLPLVVIVGPTASGKTSLSIDLAKKFNGEIISADSRAVYRGMDIGTAKPTLNERDGVPHWGLDLIEPGECFTAADFKGYAVKKIDEIRERGHVPFLVGGTGLYVDAVLFDYQFKSKSNDNLRQELQHKELNELQNICLNQGIEIPENSRNKRYLVRAIENQGVNRSRSSEPMPNTIIVGITTERDILRDRIIQRAEHIFDDGVVNEARKLGKSYGWDSEAMTSNIYPLIKLYLEGSMGITQVKERFITLDCRLAKRQLTWLRRNKFIEWLDFNDVDGYISNLLASLN